ncbi:hypothetical protein ACLI1A_02695 [Flavobacterium sp. RHBU_3]|uniref:hypothetical protein n=1 Tax=Flavobacterium sp. RHBU_3 TaxID=3391184 RepID=UPI0039849B2B
MKPRVLTVCLLLIGMVIFAYSLTLPYYKNNKAPYEVVPDDSVNYKDEYYKYEETYRTNKTDLMDFGSGLCIAATSFLFFLLVTKTTRFSDFKQINTHGKWGIFFGANIVWLLTIPGTYWYYIFRAGRGDYPPFADSIGIAISEEVTFFMFFFIPLNIFILFCIVASNLPAPLFIKVNQYNAGRILLEVLFGFLMFINLFCFIIELISGHHFLIAVSMYFVYVILSLRAGIVHRCNTNDSLTIKEVGV